MTITLAISNIAWDMEEDDHVASLLQRHSVDAIDIAPGKYFAEPADAGIDDIVAVRDWWRDRGIAIAGMQALLFGTVGLNVFGSASSQQALLSRLDAVCRIGAVLGARKLVFGSPKNRDRSGLGDTEAFERGVAFFGKAALVAAGEGVIVCLEPNPPRYGANFMTTSLETAQVVQAVDHPAIRMQLDTGAIAISGEDPQTVLANFGDVIGHIHASEPDLVPLGDGACDHRAAAQAISRSFTDPLVTIEMVATKDEPHLTSIERAIEFADHCYRRNELEHP